LRSRTTKQSKCLKTASKNKQIITQAEALYLTFHPDNLQKDVLLNKYVTFRIGGPAELFYEAEDVQNLVQAINYARENKLKWFVLGGGSNLVVSDDGIEGLVIRNACKDRNLVNTTRKQIEIATGFPLEKLVETAYMHGFAGAEYLSGIPGTIGGAIYGNAGAYGRSIADLLIDAEVLFPDGNVKKVDNSFFEFAYRTSLLKTTDYIVLNARFQFQPGNPAEIREKRKEILATRHSKHPNQSVGCAGSFFKNLPPLPGESRRRAAGAVLEQAGAKQMSCGGASVYHKHANFIINKGSATAKDVRNLADMLKAKVLKDFGIELKAEVLYIGR
jgi:UDP-N-acetylmuramate dehydrogenase